MDTSLNSTLTVEQVYATLTIANGKTIEINGTTYTCIDSVSNSTNGYQGFAYKNNSTGNIIVVHAGSNDLSKFSNWFTKETNDGFSDWATVDIPSNIKEMYYRLSRRGSDFCIENSVDGIEFKQMRICHLFKAGKTINIGVYACSPEDSSFKAEFSEMVISDCVWMAHQ